MITNMKGRPYKATKIIYKKDIVELCNLLSNSDYFKDICRFVPEPVYGGGIKFVYKENGKLFKTVRLGIRYFPFMDDNVMDNWKNSKDIVLEKDKRIKTSLKSFDGAPAFTIEEINVFETHLKEIGFVRI